MDNTTETQPADTQPANTAEPPAALPPLTLEHIYTDKIFEAKRLRQPQWLKDSRRFSYIDAILGAETLTVWIYDADTQQRTMLLDAETLTVNGEPVVLHGYHWSPDETRLLLARLPRPHDAEGDKALYVYTLETRVLSCVAKTEQEYRNVKWSPDGTRLGYVRGDDLYTLDLASGMETRLTETASAAIYNGRFGWVYQEELYLVDGWAWSPDSQRLAYFQTDETHVPTVDLTRYDDIRLAPVVQRYPKSGDPNPVVRIGILELKEAEKADWLDLGPAPDIYIAWMQWTPNGDLLLQRIPRLQNRLELLKVAAETGEVRVLLTETDAAWVDAPGELTFIGDTGQFLWPSERGGCKHLYLYDGDGQMLRQLTGGDWEVDAILGVDLEARRVVFSAGYPQPHERQIFSVSLDGGSITQLSQGAGVHHALFAPDAKRFLDTRSTRSMPPRTELCGADGQRIATILDNPLEKARAYLRAAWEFMTFETEDGVTLPAALLRPADFDPQRKYPVLMYTYGGPGSQVVQDAYGSRVGLENFLSNQGYILALVDGRGSGMRGRDFKKITYLNLGHYEVNDQIAGAKWLSQLPYVDPTRIGIWGWSYGGYMASLCILRGADVFKAAVSVAPVTHWKFYDSIYTERYMRRPQDNPEGYEQSSPLTHADKLKGKFLLMHGLADDNVHFQNAACLAERWQAQGKPFQMMAYPGKRHGLEGVGLHWATLLTDFLLNNL